MPHARLSTAIIQSIGLKSEWNFHITWTTFPVWFSFFSHFYPIHDSEHYLNTLWDKIINARNFLPSHCHVCFFKKHKAFVVWLMHCNEHFGQEGEHLPDRRILFFVLLIDGMVFFLQDTDLIFHSLWMQWSQKKQAISATWRPTTPCCLFPHTKIVKLFPFKGNKSWCSSWDRKTARTTSK